MFINNYIGCGYFTTIFLQIKIRRSVLLFCLIKLAATTSYPLDEQGPIVQLQNGQVQGLISSTQEGKKFYAFLGIPFGKAPTGALQFKPPVPAEPWNGTFQATADPPACIQPVLALPPSFVGVEDCLKLSVFTPNLPSSSTTGLPPLAVQVFLHGGCFYEGDISSTGFGPERYMDRQNTILVLVNYRLSALGFLSTGDAAASGNFGLMDQNLALQWVRDNIAAFGGNPAQVTLSGQSAGSASVIFHVLSPMSAGLFHRAIAESGSATCPWALEEHPLYFAEALAREFDCPTNDTQALVDCLKQQDAGEVQARSVYVMAENLTLAFVPVVENAESGQFLTEDPTLILQNGNFNKVPIILGLNRDEGAMIYDYVYPLGQNINDVFFDHLIPLLLRVLTDYRQNLVNVSYAIKDEYYAGVDLENKTAVDTTNVNLISDMFIKTWVVKTAELISSHDVPTYLYTFDYVSSSSSSNFTGMPDISHGAEMKFLFNSDLSAKDNAWDPEFLDLWINFIAEGKPTPVGFQWSPDPAGQSAYLDINEAFSMVAEYDPEIMRFWFEEVPAIVYLNVSLQDEVHLFHNATFLHN